jgi:hypothetical protein
VLRHGDLVVDTARRSASRGGRAPVLAPKEFGVLATPMPPTFPTVNGNITT